MRPPSRARWIVSLLLLTGAAVLVGFDAYLQDKVGAPLAPRLSLEGVVPPPPDTYQFGDQTLLDLPRQDLGRVIFVEPRPGDLIVLWRNGRRGGCYAALQVGGTVVLAPSPLCGREK